MGLLAAIIFSRLEKMFKVVLLFFLFGRLVLVFSNSPFYSVFGVLGVALSHAFVFALMGLSFLSLLLVIIYAGGMLVVFLFSTILSADRSPSFSFSLFMLRLIGVFLTFCPLVKKNYNIAAKSFTKLSLQKSLTAMYSKWGAVLCVVGVALLFALIGVLRLGFEHGVKSLRRL